MEEGSPPPGAESNIFDQFDVQVEGELSPRVAPVVDGYFCRLPRCRGAKRVFTTRIALVRHRIKAHSIVHAGSNKIPKEDQIHLWLSSGKRRSYEIPQPSPELKESPDHTEDPTRSSLLLKLLHCKPDTESELQPASLESNIYEQFDVVQHEPGEPGKSPYVGYVCLLSQCHEEKVCLNNYTKWIKHRRNVHNETEEVQSLKLPGVCQIRDWVTLNKPRPYEVPVRLKAKKEKRCPVDPDVFAEFDVKGTVEDAEQLQFFCLLGTCKELGVPFQGRMGWKRHRNKDHMSPKYKGGEFALPSLRTIKDWMKAGKTPHYKTRRRVRTTVSINPPSETSTELPNQEGLHSLRRCKSLARLGKLKPSTPPDDIPRISSPQSRPRNADAAGCSSNTEPAHQKKKRRGIHSTNRSRSTAGAITDTITHTDSHQKKKRGRPRNADAAGCSSNIEPAHQKKKRRSVQSTKRSRSTAGAIIDTDSHQKTKLRHGRRPRNADAAGCSSDTEPAHQKKKRRTNRSRSIAGAIPDADLSDQVAPKVEAHGEEPSGNLSTQFMEKTNPTRDEIPPSEDSDEEFDEEVEEVDEETNDQPENVDDHDHDSADIEEFGEEPHEDSVRPEDALPNSLPYSQPELHDSGEMAEADEDDHEEFEAPDTVLPPQAELQNVKVVEHSSVQSQDFQGVTGEHQQNSRMVDADEEAPNDYVASENVLPSLQNSSTEEKPDCDVVIPAEMGEAEEELEDFGAPENALTALAYSQPKLWEHTSVQPQEFQGDVPVPLPDPTVDIDEVEEEAPEDSGAETDEVEEEAREDSAAEIDEVEEEDPEDSGAETDEVEEEDPEDSGAETDEVEEEDPEDSAAETDEVEEEDPEDSAAIENALSSLSCLQSEFVVTGIVEHDSVPSQEIPREVLEMAAFGESQKGFIYPSVPSDESEQTVLSPLWHFDGDTIQRLPQDFPRENRPNSSKEDNLGYSAEKAEVGGEAPQGAAPENLSNPNEGTKLPSVEGLIDIQAAPTHESAPRFKMDPMFIEEPSAARVSEVRLEFSGAPGNSVDFLPSLNAPQETSEQLFLSSLNTNASLPDYSSTEIDPIIHQFLWDADFLQADIAFMKELAETVPFATSTQPEGEEICRIYMDGRDEDFTENQVDPIQVPSRELDTLIDLERVSELEPGLPLMDDPEDPEEFFHLQALALARALQPTQEFFDPGNSESSYNVPAVPALTTASLHIDMSAGLEYELSMRLEEIPACLSDE